MNFFLICAFIQPSTVFAQSDSHHSSLWLSISGALTFSSPPLYHFTQGAIASKVRPGFSTSVGIGYGALALVEPTNYSLSAELSYSHANTEDPNSENSDSQADWQLWTVLAWTRLFIPASISPFVRAGIGVSNIYVTERYGVSFLENIDIKYHSITLGIGGGVDLSLSDEVVLSAFGDAMFMPATTQLPLRSGTPRNFGRGGLPMFGLRANFKL